MTDNDLSAEEIQTLALFKLGNQPMDIDPQHFAKLLSLALIEQRESGSHLTASGIDRLGRQK